MYEEETFFEDNEPPCKVIRTNEPNLELMANAFRELYYELNLKKKEHKI
jgi:hypothetical protein